MGELTHEDGDECPELLGEDECDQNLTVRTHDRDPQFDTDPAGPVAEAICPVHGIVESV